MTEPAEFQVKKEKSLLSNAVAGGFAGISVDIVSFPLDTLKTRVQATFGNEEKIKLQNQPKKRLYAGLSSNMIISFPSAFCYFLGYEFTKRNIRSRWGNSLSEDVINMLGGCGAELLANTIR